MARAEDQRSPGGVDRPLPVLLQRPSRIGSAEATRRGLLQDPRGMPGVEPRLEVLFEGGVNQGRIGVNRFVEITATTPAKMFGM